MTAVLMTPPYLQFFDDNGVPLNGGKVYTYTATSTFTVGKATYTTAAGNVEHPNPVILDASGRPTTGNGSIWLSGTYDFKVTDSLDNTIETTLGVTAFTTLSSQSNAYFESFSGNGTTTAFTTSTDLGTDEKAILVWVDNGLQQNVTNGSFATDTGWTKGAGWTIATGTAIATGAISTALSQTSAVTLIPSEAYVLTYTVTRSAGGIIPSIGGTAGVERTSAGTYTEVISCGTTQTLAFTGNGFTGTLDNISITVANPKGYDIQNPANYTISGTTLTFATAPATGTGNIYVSAPSLLVGAASSSAADAAASAADAAASAVGASASEGAAAVSAANALAYATKLSGTSSTSVVIATGSKSFTTQSGKFFDVGNFLLIASDANEANYMHGQVTAYSGTSLTVNVIDIGGSGTNADWIITLSGTRGAIGATGPAGSGWNTIATYTPTGVTSFEITSGLTSSYKRYAIIIENFIWGGSSGQFRVQVSQDGGGNYIASGYYWTVLYSDSTGTSSISSLAAESTSSITLDGLGGTSVSGTNEAYTIYLDNPASTSNIKIFNWMGGGFNSSTHMINFNGSGAYVSDTNAINALKFTSGGVAFSAIVTLIGMNQ